MIGQVVEADRASKTIAFVYVDMTQAQVPVRVCCGRLTVNCTSLFFVNALASLFILSGPHGQDWSRESRACGLLERGPAIEEGPIKEAGRVQR